MKLRNIVLISAYYERKQHQNAEITMSNLSMVMSFKCSICCKVVYDHLRLSFNASNALSLCRICVKYQHTFGAVCAYARVFRKRPVCALIGTCEYGIPGTDLASNLYRFGTHEGVE